MVPSTWYLVENNEITFYGQGQDSVSTPTPLSDFPAGYWLLFFNALRTQHFALIYPPLSPSPSRPLGVIGTITLFSPCPRVRRSVIVFPTPRVSVSLSE